MLAADACDAANQDGIAMAAVWTSESRARARTPILLACEDAHLIGSTMDDLVLKVRREKPGPIMKSAFIRRDGAYS